MNIKIDEGFLQEHLQQALLLSLPQQARDEMIKAAIVHLTTPEKKSGYYSDGPQKSPIQQIYENAVRSAVQKIVLEEIAQNEAIKDQVLQQVKLFAEADYDTKQVITDAVIKALIDYRNE